jgi:hypothetical protein
LVRVPTQQQVLAAVGDGCDYDQAEEQLGIPPGQAYLIATGMPADGGDTFPPEKARRPGVIGGSTQQLVYRGLDAANPTQKPEVHEWIRHRAAMDEPMVAAARQRDAAPGEPEEPEDTDIAAVLTRQHDQVTALMEQLKAIPGVSKGGSEVHQSRRQSIVDMMTVALSRHETAEQEHFWPAVRSARADGGSVAGQALEQEQQGKDYLTALGKTSPRDPEFDTLAEQLEEALRKHVAFEDRLLLALRTELSEEERAALGRRIVDATAHAPTRPHPHAPKQPGGVVQAAAAGAAALDRVRDRVDDRPAERRGRAENEPAGGSPVVDDHRTEED